MMSPELIPLGVLREPQRPTCEQDPGLAPVAPGCPCPLVSFAVADTKYLES